MGARNGTSRRLTRTIRQRAFTASRAVQPLLAGSTAEGAEGLDGLQHRVAKRRELVVHPRWNGSREVSDESAGSDVEGNRGRGGGAGGGALEQMPAWYVCPRRDQAGPLEKRSSAGAGSGPEGQRADHSVEPRRQTVIERCGRLGRPHLKC